MQNLFRQNDKDYIRIVKDLTNRSNFEKTGSKNKKQDWKVTHIKDFLNENGNFEKRNTIHIAGSKGKGSIAHFVNSILLETKKRVLMYTSPDLHAVTERISINGQQISKKLFVEIASKYTKNPFFDDWSYFELITLIGWEAAQMMNCEWQVIETGLGGRLDATNAINAKTVNIITPIELEHTEILGDTIEKIIEEKVGIIHKKENTVISIMSKQATSLLKDKIDMLEAKYHLVTLDCKIVYRNQNLDYQTIDIKTPHNNYKDIKLHSIGEHQAENAAAAIRACEIAWSKIYNNQIPINNVVQGLSKVKIPGRIEKINTNPLIIIDSMHTELSALKLENTLSTLNLPKKRIIIFGTLKNKNVNKIAQIICDDSTEIIITKPISERAMPIEKIKKIFDKFSKNVSTEINLQNALDKSLTNKSRDYYVLIVGSMYLISESREIILSTKGDRHLDLR